MNETINIMATKSKSSHLHTREINLEINLETKRKGKIMASLYITSSYKNTELKYSKHAGMRTPIVRYPPNKDSMTYINSECLPSFIRE